MDKSSYIDKSKRQKAAVILNVVLTVIILVLLAVIILLSTTVTTITVDGKSMFPTLMDGDRLVLLRHGYTLNRGDIIVFTREDRNNVKRILGLGGDVIQFDMDSETWIVNGAPYAEEYIEGGYSNSYFSMMIPDILSEDGLTIPEGHIFVLGDNRNIQGGGVSLDSHIYGTLEVNNVIGKVIKVY